MATTLLGQHYAILCADCGYSFACEAGPLDGYRAICPSCGWPNSVENDSLELSGDHVLIDKSAYLFRRPQRWEVVAFRRPTQGGAAAVKRVVGLPGELIQLRDGDVFVDGQIQRKSLAQQRAMRVLIHDANFSPQAKSKPLPRWHNETKKGGWQSADGRFSHPAASSDGPIDWLVYRHWQRLDEQGDVMFHPVTDLCSYNVGWPRREEDVYAVADVMLSFRVVEATGPGRIWLKATDGDNEFLAEIDPVGRRYSVMLNGHAVSAATDALPRSLDGALIEVSLFDRQFLLAVDGQPLVQLPYQRSGKASLPAAPLAIGTQGAGLTVEDLRVYRDVYYAEPAGKKALNLRDGVRLGPDRYFVLGDNSQISQDSRVWLDGPGVAAGWLLGRPVLVICPVRGEMLGQWQFQVPDPGRIRYIR